MSSPDLLARVIDHLTDNPGVHDETIIHTGVRGSIAGWICIFGGAAINVSHDLVWAEIDGEPRGVEELAAELIGVPLSDATELFDQYDNERALTECRAHLTTTGAHNG